MGCKVEMSFRPHGWYLILVDRSKCRYVEGYEYLEVHAARTHACIRPPA